MNSSIKICKVKWLLVCVCVCVCARARARARVMEVRLCSTMGPRARHSAGALMTTIHRNKNAYRDIKLVGPPGKCQLSPCVKTALVQCKCITTLVDIIILA